MANQYTFRPSNSFERLPVELVSHIFLVGKPNLEVGSKKPLICPWALAVSHVNTLFRDVACQHTPRLWTDIHCEIYKNSPHPENFFITFDVISLLIARSRQAPLKVSFVGTDTPDWVCDSGRLGPSVQQQLRKFMDLVTPHCNRWFSFELRATDKKTMDLATDALRPLYAPQLEILDIDGAWSQELSSTTATIFSAGAPRLYSATTAFVFLDTASSGLSAITSLNCTGAISPTSLSAAATIKLFIEHVSLMPLLEDLTISHVPEFLDESDSDELAPGSDRTEFSLAAAQHAITMPSVRRLNLSGDAGHLECYFLSACFPQLIDVTLVIEDSTPELVSRALLNSRHPFGQLQRFSVQHEATTVEQDSILPFLLSQMGSLTSLHLGIAEVNFPMLPDMDSNFPKLQKLTINENTHEKPLNGKFGTWDFYWR